MGLPLPRRPDAGGAIVGRLAPLRAPRLLKEQPEQHVVEPDESEADDLQNGKQHHEKSALS